MNKLLIITFIIILLTASQTASASNYRVFTDQYYQDLSILTECIYHESRGESYMGMLAVGLVVAERVKSKRFKNTFTEVIERYRIVKGKRVYQFSYKAKKKLTYKNLDAYAESNKMAKYILQNFDNEMVMGLMEHSNHYHNLDVNPTWNRGMTLVAVIDNHKIWRSN